MHIPGEVVKSIRISPRWAVACILCCAPLIPATPLVADDGRPTLLDRLRFERNITMKTLGGRQFWGDVLFFHEWRIQQNVVTEHYRLLDGDDYRHASGTLEECKTKLEEIKKSRQLEPMSGKAVVLVHGIIRSSKSFNGMRRRLQQQGYQVFGFDYPSTRVSIEGAADYLHRTVESLDGIEEINFVVHSMGGLVVRAYLSRYDDERIGRLAMIGVPNLGARMADRLKDVFLFKTIYGPAGQQLVSDPEGLVSKLAIPDFEFAVIAGGRGNIRGYNPLIPGDDDGTVAVSNTRLPGATDFIVVSGLHSSLMNNAEVVGHVVRFLNTGRLRESGEAHAIPRPAEEAREEAGRLHPASSAAESPE